MRSSSSRDGSTTVSLSGLVIETPPIQSTPTDGADLHWQCGKRPTIGTLAPIVSPPRAAASAVNTWWTQPSRPRPPASIPAASESRTKLHRSGSCAVRRSSVRFAASSFVTLTAVPSMRMAHGSSSFSAGRAMSVKSNRKTARMRSAARREVLRPEKNLLAVDRLMPAFAAASVSPSNSPSTWRRMSARRHRCRSTQCTARPCRSRSPPPVRIGARAYQHGSSHPPNHAFPDDDKNSTQ